MKSIRFLAAVAVLAAASTMAHAQSAAQPGAALPYKIGFVNTEKLKNCK